MKKGVIGSGNTHLTPPQLSPLQDNVHSLRGTPPHAMVYTSPAHRVSPHDQDTMVTQMTRIYPELSVIPDNTRTSTSCLLTSTRKPLPSLIEAKNINLLSKEVGVRLKSRTAVEQGTMLRADPAMSLSHPNVTINSIGLSSSMIGLGPSAATTQNIPNESQIGSSFVGSKKLPEFSQIKQRKVSPSLSSTPQHDSFHDVSNPLLLDNHMISEHNLAEFEKSFNDVIKSNLNIIDTSIIDDDRNEFDSSHFYRNTPHILETTTNSAILQNSIDPSIQNSPHLQHSPHLQNSPHLQSSPHVQNSPHLIVESSSTFNSPDSHHSLKNTDYSVDSNIMLGQDDTDIGFKQTNSREQPVIQNRLFDEIMNEKIHIESNIAAMNFTPLEECLLQGTFNLPTDIPSALEKSISMDIQRESMKSGDNNQVSSNNINDKSGKTIKPTPPQESQTKRLIQVRNDLFQGTPEDPNKSKASISKPQSKYKLLRSQQTAQKDKSKKLDQNIGVDKNSNTIQQPKPNLDVKNRMNKSLVYAPNNERKSSEGVISISEVVQQKISISSKPLRNSTRNVQKSHTDKNTRGTTKSHDIPKKSDLSKQDCKAIKSIGTTMFFQNSPNKKIEVPTKATSLTPISKAQIMLKADQNTEKVVASAKSSENQKGCLTSLDPYSFDTESDKIPTNESLIKRVYEDDVNAPQNTITDTEISKDEQTKLNSITKSAKKELSNQDLSEPSGLKMRIKKTETMSTKNDSLLDSNKIQPKSDKNSLKCTDSKKRMTKVSVENDNHDTKTGNPGNESKMPTKEVTGQEPEMDTPGIMTCTMGEKPMSLKLKFVKNSPTPESHTDTTHGSSSSSSDDKVNNTNNRMTLRIKVPSSCDDKDIKGNEMKNVDEEEEPKSDTRVQEKLIINLKTNQITRSTEDSINNNCPVPDSSDTCPTTTSLLQTSSLSPSKDKRKHIRKIDEICQNLRKTTETDPYSATNTGTKDLFEVPQNKITHNEDKKVFQAPGSNDPSIPEQSKIMTIKFRRMSKSGENVFVKHCETTSVDETDDESPSNSLLSNDNSESDSNVEFKKPEFKLKIRIADQTCNTLDESKKLSDTQLVVTKNKASEYEDKKKQSPQSSITVASNQGESENITKSEQQPESPVPTKDCQTSVTENEQGKPNITTEMKTFTCETCSKTFKDEFECNKHKVLLHKYNAFLCHICYVSFVEKWKLDIHLMSEEHLAMTNNEHSGIPQVSESSQTRTTRRSKLMNLRSNDSNSGLEKEIKSPKNNEMQNGKRKSNKQPKKDNSNIETKKIEENDKIAKSNIFTDDIKGHKSSLEIDSTEPSTNSEASFSTRNEQKSLTDNVIDTTVVTEINTAQTSDDQGKAKNVERSPSKPLVKNDKKIPLKLKESLSVEHGEQFDEKNRNKCQEFNEVSLNESPSDDIQSTESVILTSQESNNTLTKKDVQSLKKQNSPTSSQILASCDTVVSDLDGKMSEKIPTLEIDSTLVSSMNENPGITLDLLEQSIPSSVIKTRRLTIRTEELNRIQDAQQNKYALTRDATNDLKSLIMNQTDSIISTAPEVKGSSKKNLRPLPKLRPLPNLIKISSESLKVIPHLKASQLNDKNCFNIKESTEGVDKKELQSKDNAEKREVEESSITVTSELESIDKGYPEKNSKIKSDSDENQELISKELEASSPEKTNSVQEVESFDKSNELDDLQDKRSHRKNPKPKKIIEDSQKGIEKEVTSLSKDSQIETRRSSRIKHNVVKFTHETTPNHKNIKDLTKKPVENERTYSIETRNQAKSDIKKESAFLDHEINLDKDICVNKITSLPVTLDNVEENQNEDIVPLRKSPRRLNNKVAETRKSPRRKSINFTSRHGELPNDEKQYSELTHDRSNTLSDHLVPQKGFQNKNHDKLIDETSSNLDCNKIVSQPCSNSHDNLRDSDTITTDSKDLDNQDLLNTNTQNKTVPEVSKLNVTHEPLVLDSETLNSQDALVSDIQPLNTELLKISNDTQIVQTKKSKTGSPSKSKNKKYLVKKQLEELSQIAAQYSALENNSVKTTSNQKDLSDTKRETDQIKTRRKTLGECTNKESEKETPESLTPIRKSSRNRKIKMFPDEILNGNLRPQKKVLSKTTSGNISIKNTTVSLDKNEQDNNSSTAIKGNVSNVKIKDGLNEGQNAKSDKDLNLKAADENNQEIININTAEMSVKIESLKIQQSEIKNDESSNDQITIGIKNEKADNDEKMGKTHEAPDLSNNLSSRRAKGNMKLDNIAIKVKEEVFGLKENKTKRRTHNTLETSGNIGYENEKTLKLKNKTDRMRKVYSTSSDDNLKNKIKIEVNGEVQNAEKNEINTTEYIKNMYSELENRNIIIKQETSLPNSENMQDLENSSTYDDTVTQSSSDMKTKQNEILQETSLSASCKMPKTLVPGKIDQMCEIPRNSHINTTLEKQAQQKGDESKDRTKRRKQKRLSRRCKRKKRASLKNLIRGMKFRDKERQLIENPEIMSHKFEKEPEIPAESDGVLGQNKEPVESAEEKQEQGTSLERSDETEQPIERQENIKEAIEAPVKKLDEKEHHIVSNEIEEKREEIIEIFETVSKDIEEKREEIIEYPEIVSDESEEKIELHPDSEDKSENSIENSETVSEEIEEKREEIIEHPGAVIEEIEEKKKEMNENRETVSEEIEEKREEIIENLESVSDEIEENREAKSENPEAVSEEIEIIGNPETLSDEIEENRAEISENPENVSGEIEEKREERIENTDIVSEEIEEKREEIIENPEAVSDEIEEKREESIEDPKTVSEEIVEKREELIEDPEAVSEEIEEKSEEISENPEAVSEEIEERREEIIENPETLSEEIEEKREGIVENPETVSEEIEEKKEEIIENAETVSEEIEEKREGIIENPETVPEEIEEKEEIIENPETASEEIEEKREEIFENPKSVSEEIEEKREEIIENPESVSKEIKEKREEIIEHTETVSEEIEEKEEIIENPETVSKEIEEKTEEIIENPENVSEEIEEKWEGISGNPETVYEEIEEKREEISENPETVSEEIEEKKEEMSEYPETVSEEIEEKREEIIENPETVSEEIEEKEEIMENPETASEEIEEKREGIIENPETVSEEIEEKREEIIENPETVSEEIEEKEEIIENPETVSKEIEEVSENPETLSEKIEEIIENPEVVSGEIEEKRKEIIKNPETLSEEIDEKREEINENPETVSEEIKEKRKEISENPETVSEEIEEKREEIIKNSETVSDEIEENRAEISESPENVSGEIEEKREERIENTDIVSGEIEEKKEEIIENPEAVSDEIEEKREESIEDPKTVSEEIVEKREELIEDPEAVSEEIEERREEIIENPETLSEISENPEAVSEEIEEKREEIIENPETVSEEIEEKREQIIENPETVSEEIEENRAEISENPENVSGEIEEKREERIENTDIVSGEIEEKKEEIIENPEAVSDEIEEKREESIEDPKTVSEEIVEKREELIEDPEAVSEEIEERREEIIENPETLSEISENPEAVSEEIEEKREEIIENPETVSEEIEEKREQIIENPETVSEEIKEKREEIIENPETVSEEIEENREEIIENPEAVSEEIEEKRAEIIENPESVCEEIEEKSEEDKSENDIECEEDSSELEDKNVEADDTNEEPVESGDNSETPVEADDTNEEPVESGDYSETPVEANDPNEEPVESGDNSETPVEADDRNEEPIELGEKSETPVEADKTMEEPVESGDNSETPVEADKTMEEPVESGDNSETPVEADDRNEEPIELGEKSETPVEDDKTMEEPVESGDNSETPVETDKTIEEPVESGDNSKTPVEADDTNEEPVESEYNSETLVETDKTMEEPVESGDNSETPVETDKTMEELVESGDNSETPIETDKTMEEPVESGDNSETLVEADDTNEEPVELGDNSETPVEADKTMEEPVESRDNSETPVEADKTMEKPVESGDNSETPVEANKTMEEPVELEHKNQESVEADDTKKKPVESGVNSETPVEAADTNEEPVESGDNSETPIEANDTNEEPVESADNSETPVKANDTNEEEPVELGEKSETPVEADKTMEEPVESGDNSETLVETGKTVEEPVESGDNSKTPVEADNTNEEPVELGVKSETPVEADDTNEEPVESGDNSKTPVEAADTNEKEPVESGDNSETPVKANDTNEEEPVESADNSETPVKDNDTNEEEPVESADNSETPVEANKTMEEPVESGDNSETPVEADDTNEEESVESGGNSKTPVEAADTNEKEPVESGDNSETPVKANGTNEEEPVESADNSEIPVKANDTNEEEPVESADNSETPVEANKTMEEPVESGDNSETPVEADKTMEEPVESGDNSETPVEADKTMEEPAESEDKNQEPVEANDTNEEEPIESGGNTETPVEAADTNEEPVESGDNSQTPVKANDTNEEDPVESADNSETPVKANDTNKEEPVESADNSETPVKANKTMEEPVESGDNSETPVEADKTMEEPVKSGDNSETPVEADDTNRKPVESGDNGETPVEADKTMEEPVESGDNSETPVEADKTMEEPVKFEDKNQEIFEDDDTSEEEPVESGDNSETPVKANDTNEEEPVESADNSETPVKVNDTNEEEPVESGDKSETPVEADKTMKEPIESEDTNEEPGESEDKNEELLELEDTNEESVESENEIEGPIKSEHKSIEPIESEDKIEEPSVSYNTNKESAELSDKFKDPVESVDTDNIPVELEDKIEGPIKLEDTNEEIIESEDQCEDPVKSADTDDTPAELQDTNKEPIEQKDTNKETMEPEDTNEETIEPEDTNEETIEPEDTNKEPIEPEFTNKEPIEQEETNKEPIEPEETNKEPIELEETDKEPIEPEDTNKETIEQDDTNKKPIEPEETNKEPIEQEETNKETIEPEDTNKETIKPEDMNKKNIEQDDTNKEPIEPEETNKEPIEPEETNKEPIEPEDTNKETIEQDETNKKPIEPEETNKEPIEQEETNKETIEPEDTNKESMEQKDTNKESIEPEDTNEETIEQEETNKEPMEQKDMNKESIEPEEANKEPIEPEEINKEPIEPEETNKEAIEPEETNKEPIEPEDTNKETIEPEDTNKEPFEQEDTNQETIDPEDTNEETIELEETNKEPIEPEDTNKEPIEQEDTNKETIEPEDTNKEPIEQKDTNKESIEPKEANKEPIEPKDTNKETFEPEDRNEETIEQDDTNKEPIEPEETNKEPIEPEETNKEPIEPEETNKEPIEPEDTNKETIKPEETNKEKVLDPKKPDDQSSDISRSPKKKISQQYQCKKCFEMFGNEENLLKHDNHVHNTKTKIITCISCQRDINELEYEKHRGLCIDIVTCNDCNQMFSNKSILKKHIVTDHHLVVTNGQNTLKRKSEETNNDTIKKSKSNFNIDLKVDENTSKLNNKHHKRKSDDLEILDSEAKKMKSGKKSKREKGYPCGKCTEVLNSSGDLDQHLQQVHNKPECIQCEECSKTFRSVVLLDKHLINAHKNIIKCSTCCKVFKTLYLYSKHNRLVHNAGASPDKTKQTSTPVEETSGCSAVCSTGESKLGSLSKEDRSKKIAQSSEELFTTESAYTLEDPFVSEALYRSEEPSMSENVSANVPVNSENVFSTSEPVPSANVSLTENSISSGNLSNNESLSSSSKTDQENVKEYTHTIQSTNEKTEMSLSPLKENPSMTNTCTQKNSIVGIENQKDHEMVETKVSTSTNNTNPKIDEKLVPCPTKDENNQAKLETNENPRTLVTFINFLKKQNEHNSEQLSSRSINKETPPIAQNNKHSNEPKMSTNNHVAGVEKTVEKSPLNVPTPKKVVELLPKVDVKLNFTDQFKNCQLPLDSMQLKYPGKILLPLQPSGPLEELQIYKCARCDKPFSDKIELRQHISDKHIALPPLDEAYKKEKKAMEKITKKSYVLVQKDQLHSVLRKELLKTGGGQKTNEKLFYALNLPELKCCHCEATFASQKNLELHSKTFHTNLSTESSSKRAQSTSLGNIPSVSGDNSPPKTILIQRRNSVAGSVSTTSPSKEILLKQRRSSTSGSNLPVMSMTTASTINSTLAPVTQDSEAPDNEPSSVTDTNSVITTAPCTLTANTIMFTPGPTDLECYRCGVKFNNGPERHFCTVFKCDKCFEAFVSKELLNAHYLLKHDVYLVPQHVKNINEFANIKNLNCKFCTAMFTKNKDLNKHYREFHKYCPNQMKTSVIKNYKDVTKFIHCTMCNDIFNSNFDLQKHYLDYHNYDSSVKKFEVPADTSNQISNLLNASHLNSSITKRGRKRKNTETTQRNDTLKSINNLNNINNVLNDALGYTVSSTVLNNVTPVTGNIILPNTLINNTATSGIGEVPVANTVITYPYNNTVELSGQSVIVNSDTNITSITSSEFLPASDVTSTPSMNPSLHPSLQETSNCFVCEHCPTIFVTESALSAHLLKDHKSTLTYTAQLPLTVRRNGKCDFCSSEFEDDQKLKEHIEQVHKDLQTCIQCNRKFSNKYNLKRHVAVTHDARYVCSECNEIFSKKADLTKHRLHAHAHTMKESGLSHSFTTPTDYQCHICERYLSSKYHLRRHMDKIHNSQSNNVPSQCKTCLKGVVGINRFSSHLMVDHKVKPNSLESFTESAVVCNECRKIFMNKKIFKLHMKKKHKFKPHQCHICSRTYAFKKHIARHMEIHDSLKDFLSFSAPQDDENEWGDFEGDFSEGAENVQYQTTTDMTLSEPQHIEGAYNTQEMNLDQPSQNYHLEKLTVEEQPIHTLDNSHLYLQNIQDAENQMISTQYETQVIKNVNQQSMASLNSDPENLVNVHTMSQVDSSLHPSQFIEEVIPDPQQLTHLQNQHVDYTNQIQEMSNTHENIQTYESMTDHNEQHILNAVEPTTSVPLETSNQTFLNHQDHENNMGEFHELQNSEHMQMMQSLDETNFQMSEDQEVCKTLILQNADPSTSYNTQHTMFPPMILDTSGQTYITPSQMSYVPQVIDGHNQSDLSLTDQQASRESVVLQTPMSQMYESSFQNTLPSNVDVANQAGNNGPIFVLLLKQPDQTS
ncbi:hypothetical protein M8J76_009830 [Diaphorina citri]|nr:hypothetical protein M8J76_009830 [Diaphorina citri]